MSRAVVQRAAFVAPIVIGAHCIVCIVFRNDVSGNVHTSHRKNNHFPALIFAIILRAFSAVAPPG